MILVRKRHLYTLVSIFFALLVFGEIKFYHLIKRAGLNADLAMKYEVENFIFTAVVFFLLMALFLIYFIRASRNVLKKLDKMVELSEYGKYDISSQLKEIGDLGTRVDYLLYYLHELNAMKSLKISSMAGMNRFFMDKSCESALVVDYAGNITACTTRFLDKFGIGRKDLEGVKLHEVAPALHSEELYVEIDKRTVLDKKGSVLKGKWGDVTRDLKFYPVVNSKGEVSHMICVVEGGESVS